MKRLLEIQQKLKAPKDQKNTHGGYNYRSCEGILEAVKPLLKEQGLTLIINDEIISIDGGFELKEQAPNNARHLITQSRVYVKATATLYDETGKELTHTSAYAREEETKKGMAYAQLTGATSSYARKYALNGLFAIDDTKDADATNTHGKDNDIDICEGLKACDNMKNLNNYYKNYENKVVDLKKFQQIYTETANILKQKEG